MPEQDRQQTAAFTDRDLQVAFDDWAENAPHIAGVHVVMGEPLDMALARPRRERRSTCPDVGTHVRSRTAVRPRERRDRTGRSSARSGDSGEDGEPPAEPWRWASAAAWRSFVADVVDRTTEREIARERDGGWS